VVYGDIPVANPITFHQGQLIAGELRVGGRIMQLDLNGGAPRVILDNVPMPTRWTWGRMESSTSCDGHQRDLAP